MKLWDSRKGAPYLLSWKWLPSAHQRRNSLQIIWILPLSSATDFVLFLTKKSMSSFLPLDWSWDRHSWLSLTACLRPSKESRLAQGRCMEREGAGWGWEGTPQEAQDIFSKISLSPFPGPHSNLQVPSFPSLPHLISKADFPLALFPPLTKLGILGSWAKALRIQARWSVISSGSRLTL